MVPILEPKIKEQIEAVKHLILSEVNIKEIEYVEGGAGILVKKIKPNFKTLGPKYGKLMKQISSLVAGFTQEDISKIESEGFYHAEIEGEIIELTSSDVEVVTDDIPGWVVLNAGNLTVALDITITEKLKEEGVARELINRIQNLRKDNNFEVTDKIIVQIEEHIEITSAITNYFSYICSEILASSLTIVKTIEKGDIHPVELTDEIKTNISVLKES
jgi:isoleucyl-tRNA synthetase